MRAVLEELAACHGIERSYVDASGRLRRTQPETLRTLLQALGVATDDPSTLAEQLRRAQQASRLPAVLVTGAGKDAAVSLRLQGVREWRLVLEDGTNLAGAVAEAGGRKLSLLLPEPLPAGYHHLSLLRQDGEEHELLLIAAPGRCPTPHERGIDRHFGVSCEIERLRSARDLGHGDLADLAVLAERAGGEGADFLGITPLHARLFAAPGAIGPEAPSHRAFRNWLLVAPEPGQESGDGIVGDHAHAAARRLALLEAGFLRFRERHLGARPSPRGQAFLGFVAAGGEMLRRQCLFDALHERELARDPTRAIWWHWPEDYRTPDAAGALAHAQAAAGRLEFLAWLQWLAEQQLGRAAERARGAGMRLGLFTKLAAGVSAAGSLAWAEPGLVPQGVSLGAPPDRQHPAGQRWGIAPLAPHALQTRRFVPWIADVRANMRHAGALRIDHAMGLRRQFWIPDGAEPEAGTYVRCPFTIHLAILAIEAHRAGCLVIAEDLGDLPRGFRPALHRAGLLSSRVLYLEREPTGSFAATRHYRHASVAAVGTHELPPLAGFIAGTDLPRYDRRELPPDTSSLTEARRERRLDRLRLRGLIERAGFEEAIEEGGPLEPWVLAVYRWLARTPAALVQVTIEDLLLAQELPVSQGSPDPADPRPGGPFRYPVDTADLLAQPFARRLLALLRTERPSRPVAETSEPTRGRGVQLM